MAKAPGLYRPDGRPARQFGEEIIEPGEPFSDKTLGTIQSLIAKDDPPIASTNPDPVTAPSEQTGDGDDPAPDSHHALREDLGQIIEDLDRFASARMPESREEAATGTNPPPIRSNTPPPGELIIEATPPQPAIHWRRLIISEGWPGRIARRLLSHPRTLSLALLAGVAWWRPLFIPALLLILVVAGFLAVVLFGVDRAAEKASGGFQRLERSHPQRSKTLSRWAWQLATRSDWLATRVPEAWQQTLEDAEPLAHDAPNPDAEFLEDRFARIAKEEQTTSV